MISFSWCDFSSQNRNSDGKNLGSELDQESSFRTTYLPSGHKTKKSRAPESWMHLEDMTLHELAPKPSTSTKEWAMLR